MENKANIERINDMLKKYLSQYQRSDSSVEPRDSNFVDGLVTILNAVPEDCYIRLKVNLSERSTGLENELVQRLVRAGAIEEAQGEITLCYKASRISSEAGNVPNTSSSRNAAFSGASRKVFKYDSYPDCSINPLKAIGSQAVIEVNPSGLFLIATARHESHNILPYMIKEINITTDSTPLTPLYDIVEKQSIRTEEFWEQ